ncbi:hypothetical protein HMPREF9372_1325 [Sporosarcina newyorkensis 2681]|uniref:Uncharacterized protein n=1 Tax=Sporosarcina newyorkensis 2681 TaxID=1027292 RepID=F9DR95_9BACL|nr:hypothetical protein HMPREF9372_1325 [Sporosarcina newyorkensis 2681]
MLTDNSTGDILIGKFIQVVEYRSPQLISCIAQGVSCGYFWFSITHHEDRGGYGR